MPSLVVTGTQIKEKQRGAQCAPQAYMVPKHPSLNRVNYVGLLIVYCTGNTAFHKFILNMGLLLQLLTVLSTFTIVNLLLSRTKDKTRAFS